MSMFFSYIMRLFCNFNVIFFMVPSNNKRKLGNQNLDREPLNWAHNNLSTADIQHLCIIPFLLYAKWSFTFLRELLVKSVNVYFFSASKAATGLRSQTEIDITIRVLLSCCRTYGKICPLFYFTKRFGVENVLFLAVIFVLSLILRVQF